MTEQTTKTARQVQDELKAPFPADVVKWKPQNVTDDKNRCRAVCYVNAAAVMDRLDDVLGIGNWEDDYEILEGGAVACRLWLRVEGEWHLHCDSGRRSEQKDRGDQQKAAFSDALKRAARRFGVGRYLAKLPAVWADYDPTTKQIKTLPTLPSWALPKAKKPETLPPVAPAAQQPAPAPTPAPSANGPSKPSTPARAPQKKQAPPAPVPGAITPEEGTALARLLKDTGSDHKLLFAEFSLTRLGELDRMHLGNVTARIQRGDFKPKPDQPQPAPRYPAPPQTPAIPSHLVGPIPSLKAVETGAALAQWLQLMNAPGSPPEARGASEVVNKIARDVGDLRPVSQWDPERVRMARAAILSLLEGRTRGNVATPEPVPVPNFDPPALAEGECDPDEGRYVAEDDGWPPPDAEM